MIDFSFNLKFEVYFFIHACKIVWNFNICHLLVISHNMKIIMDLSVLLANFILFCFVIFFNGCNVCILAFFSSQHGVCGGGNMSAIHPSSIFLYPSLSLVSLFPPPPAPEALSDLEWVKGKSSFLL